MAIAGEHFLNLFVRKVEAGRWNVLDAHGASDKTGVAFPGRVWHRPAMTTLPRIFPLDLGDAETVNIELELALPRLTTADQELACRQFSGILQRADAITNEKEMQRMVELFGRCLLLVATKLVENPAAALAPFREKRYEPWHERICDILTLGKSAEQANETAIRATCMAWQLSDQDIDALSEVTLVIVAASLAVQGRLPLAEKPARVN